MARNRMIKKEFWSDEKIGHLPMLARFAFIGIWNLSDDIGICRANPAHIRGQIFPYDKNLLDSDIEQVISELAKGGFIILARYAGEKYLKVKHFSRHQVINRPSKSFTIAGLGKEQIDELFSESRDQQGATESLPSVEEVVSAEIAKIFAPDPASEEVDEDSACKNRDSEISIEPVDDSLQVPEEVLIGKKIKQSRPSFQLPSYDTG